MLVNFVIQVERKRLMTTIDCLAIPTIGSEITIPTPEAWQQAIGWTCGKVESIRFFGREVVCRIVIQGDSPFERGDADLLLATGRYVDYCKHNFDKEGYLTIKTELT
jgi:hypothetical protein